MFAINEFIFPHRFGRPVVRYDCFITPKLFVITWMRCVCVSLCNRFHNLVEHIVSLSVSNKYFDLNSFCRIKDTKGESPTGKIIEHTFKAPGGANYISVSSHCGMYLKKEK